MLREQFARTLQSLLGERNRLGFFQGIGDHSFLVQPIHRTPVVSLPRPVPVAQRQKEQRERHFVDFIFVVFHTCNRTISAGRRKSLPHQPSNQLLDPTAGQCTES